MHVPGLRSPYEKVGRIVYFGRMLDKIRLHAAGRLPVEEYAANLGKGFDARCCSFLRINYPELCARLAGATATDLALLQWAEQRGGGPRPDEDCEVWNDFMMKRGVRDEAAPILERRIRESGLEGKPILTMFDYIDFDEGRDPVATRAWESVLPVRENLRRKSAGPAVILLMGVAGSGKTTVGIELARALGWEFRDADDFHPPENVAKMSAGTPLTDVDRAPWLAAIRAYIEATTAAGRNAVVTCSALKERYRQAAVPAGSATQIVHLSGPFNLILERMRQRRGHFMKPEMLQSQFATLEPPANALTIDIAQSPAEIVADIRRQLAI